MTIVLAATAVLARRVQGDEVGGKVCARICRKHRVTCYKDAREK